MLEYDGRKEGGCDGLFWNVEHVLVEAFDERRRRENRELICRQTEQSNGWTNME